MIKELNDKNVDAIIKENKAHFILFHDPKSPNAHNLEKVFEKFDAQLQGKVEIMICDITENDHVAEYFQMNILPAVLFLKGEKVYGNLAGPASALKYEELLKSSLMQLIREQH